MTTRYRVIWLIPDPYLGGRVPLGVLVEREGEVTFVHAELGLGGAMTGEALALAQVVSAELASAADFDNLPASVGPHVLAAEPVAVPIAVPDHWFAEKVLRAA